MEFLRKQLNRLLHGEALVPKATVECERKLHLQKQAHDHVLREEERRRDAFTRTCFLRY